MERRIEKMPFTDRERRALKMRDLTMSYKEIAVELKVSVARVHQILAKARRKIRNPNFSDVAK
jgi:RNA polymerase sigma factor (sigma-70 family)